MSDAVQDTKPTETEAGAQAETGQVVSFTAEQQAHIDKLISDRLKRANEKWQEQQAAAQQKAAEEAEAAKLEEQQEYQKLLEKARAKIAELEPLTGQVEAATATLEKYQTVINDILSQRVEALGDTAKNAVNNLPGDPDALAKLQWLNANEALFKATDPPVTGGTPPRRPAPGRTPQPQPTTNGTQPDYTPVVRF